MDRGYFVEKINKVRESRITEEIARQRDMEAEVSTKREAEYTLRRLVTQVLDEKDLVLGLLKRDSAPTNDSIWYGRTIKRPTTRRVGDELSSFGLYHRTWRVGIFQSSGGGYADSSSPVVYHLVDNGDLVRNCDRFKTMAANNSRSFISVALHEVQIIETGLANLVVDHNLEL